MLKLPPPLLVLIAHLSLTLLHFFWSPGAAARVAAAPDAAPMNKRSAGTLYVYTHDPCHVNVVYRYQSSL